MLKKCEQNSLTIFLSVSLWLYPKTLLVFKGEETICNKKTSLFCYRRWWCRYSCSFGKTCSCAVPDVQRRCCSTPLCAYDLTVITFYMQSAKIKSYGGTCLNFNALLNAATKSCEFYSNFTDRLIDSLTAHYVKEMFNALENGIYITLILLLNAYLVELKHKISSLIE